MKASADPQRPEKEVASGDARSDWHWVVGTIENALEEATDQWRHLALTTGAAAAAFPLWYASTYEAFGEMGGALSVHRLYAGDRLVAVLPLSLATGLCRTWRSYQHRWYTTVWAFPIDSKQPGIGAEICRHLLESADLIRLEYLQQSCDAVASLLRGADRYATITESFAEKAELYHEVDVGWDECAKAFSVRILKDSEKYLGRLKRSGTLRMAEESGTAELDSLLTECFQLEKAGWKGRKGTAIACDASVERFYRGLARRARDTGNLALYTLRLDGRLIAFDICVKVGGRVDSLKISYDESMRKLSPGNVLTYLVLKQECQDADSLRYYRGNPTAHKLRWTTLSDPAVRILLFGDTFRGRAAYVAFRHVRPVWRRVRAWLERSRAGSDPASD